MSTVEEKLVIAVAANALLVAAIGARFYPMKLPATLSLESGSTDLPAVTYARLSAARHTEVPVSHPTYQMTVFGATYSQTRLAANLLVGCFTGLKSGPIRASAVMNDHDLSDPETGLFMIPVDIKITYMEEV